HEQQHVDFLRTTAIPLFGGTAPTITANDFDFTGGNGSGTGPFATATTRVDVLLLATQAFEDTGVRAYKGQAGRFLIAGNTNADIAMESALRIHSVEARHASKIRRIRRQLNPSDTTLRFSGYIRGGGVAAAGASNIASPPAEVVAALNLIYGGGTGPVSFPDSNTRHVIFNGTNEVTVDAATVGGTSAIGGAAAQALAATQAFDEALTKAEVITIVQGFIKNDPARGLP
nr:ferritin-like domain-containing protein [Gemmatimonadaceae bacterium]